MICQNCGNELRDESAFCDKCGTAISFDKTEAPPQNTTESIFKDYDIQDMREQPEPPKKKWSSVLPAVGAVVMVGIILIVIAGRAKIAPGNGDADSKTTQQTVQQKPLTEEEKLRNDYLSQYNSVSRFDTLYFSSSDAAETLLRGQPIFKNAKIQIYGEVASIMQVQNDNTFHVSIKPNYNDKDDNSNVKHVIVKGTYNDSEKRLVKGDIIDAKGTYAGVELYTIGDSQAEFAVLDKCKLIDYDFKFSTEDIKKVVKSIFGDVNTQTEPAQDEGGEVVKFTRTNVELNRIENWNFYQAGGVFLSLDGGNNPQRVEFDLDFQHYYLVGYRDKYNTTYCDFEGHELWKKEFEEYPSYQIADGVIYLYADNDIRILNSKDGTDKIEPIYMPEKNRMYVSDDIIYMITDNGSKDAIVALDLSGKIVWRFSLDDKFDFYDMAKVGDELLVESSYWDRYSKEHKIYHRYKRINAKTGEAVSEFKMPNDYN